MIGHRNLETNPITIKPETGSHGTDQFSWVLFHFCSLPGRPFPTQSIALSARVSPWTLIPNATQEPSLGSWRESPFLQQYGMSFCCLLVYWQEEMQVTMWQMYL